MKHFTSPNWKLFASRPTSILKRDFMKWTYLSLNRIKGFKLTKLLAIGSDKEMDVFVDAAEDEKNYLNVRRQRTNKKIEGALSSWEKLMKDYKSHGKDPTNQSLHAMEEVGSFIIYSYYIERLSTLGETVKDNLIERNGYLRDAGAKIIYPLYDRAHDWLQNKYKGKTIDNYTLDELKNDLTKNEMRKRSIFYIFLGTKKETKIYTGIAAKNFLHEHAFTAVGNVKVDTIKGLAACRGKVRGQVQIVQGLEDIKKCNGKVVIARETIIEYVPYLKKAVAIVTDLGSINCHAAITAREFKLPCIVGTSCATQMFEDGDMVEVDALRGVVRKL